MFSNGVAPSPCFIGHANFGGCCINGISCTLVTMDVNITPPNFLQQTYDLVSWLQGCRWRCCFGFGMHVINDATWWSTTSCHCEQGGPTKGALVHDYELSSSSHVFCDDNPNMILDPWYFCSVESNVDECECVMGFDTHATQVFGLSKAIKCQFLG